MSIFNKLTHRALALLIVAGLAGSAAAQKSLTYYNSSTFSESWLADGASFTKISIDIKMAMATNSREPTAAISWPTAKLWCPTFPPA